MFKFPLIVVGLALMGCAPDVEEDEGRRVDPLQANQLGTEGGNGNGLGDTPPNGNGLGSTINPNNTPTTLGAEQGPEASGLGSAPGEGGGSSGGKEALCQIGCQKASDCGLLAQHNFSNSDCMSYCIDDMNDAQIECGLNASCQTLEDCLNLDIDDDEPRIVVGEVDSGVTEPPVDQTQVLCQSACQKFSDCNVDAGGDQCVDNCVSNATPTQVGCVIQSDCSEVSACMRGAQPVELCPNACQFIEGCFGAEAASQCLAGCSSYPTTIQQCLIEVGNDCDAINQRCFSTGK